MKLHELRTEIGPIVATEHEIDLLVVWAGTSLLAYGGNTRGEYAYFDYEAFYGQTVHDAQAQAKRFAEDIKTDFYEGMAR